MAKLKNGPVEEFVFTNWVKEGAGGMRLKMKNKRARWQNRLQKHTPIDTSEFRAHMRRARQEQLLAVRSLVDSALNCLKDEETHARPR